MDTKEPNALHIRDTIKKFKSITDIKYLYLENNCLVTPNILSKQR